MIPITKPRIFYRKGWWRVSGVPRNIRGRTQRSFLTAWHKAHKFVTDLNRNRYTNQEK